MNDFREFVVECIPSDNGLWWPNPAHVDPSRPNTEEIVRCKGCKHYRKTVWCGITDITDACLFFADGVKVQPDGFCAWGERAGDA